MADIGNREAVIFVNESVLDCVFCSGCADFVPGNMQLLFESSMIVNLVQLFLICMHFLFPFLFSVNMFGDSAATNHWAFAAPRLI